MKRVLIVTYYWPPAGGPGVQRWLKFVTYFTEFGIEPIVYIPKNPHYPLQDEALLNEVPSNLEVIKTPIKEPYRFAKFLSKKKTSKLSSGVMPTSKKSMLDQMMLYVRGNFFIPDARVGWVQPSVSFLTKYIVDNNIDALVTTGPPHSLHLIGMKLKRAVSIPWLADFRDPWTTIHYHEALNLSRKAKKKHKKLESEVLNTADHVVVTSPRTKLEFQELTSQPISVVTNGYETQEYSNQELDTAFSIAHIGSLLSDRNPIVLWEVISELCNEDENFRSHLEIQLAGTISETVLQSLSAYGLSEYVHNKGYVSHTEAQQLQRNAQILLVLEIDSPETRAIIPGKLFECLAARRPIVAIGPADSDIAAIIKETESGAYFTSAEKHTLKTTLSDYFTAYKNDGIKIASKNIEKYSRRSLTEKLTDVLKTIF